MNVEDLAKALHEAGREAVEKGATVAADHHGEKTRTFLSWDEITENAQEGRRIQARWLLDKYSIEPKGKYVGVGPVEGAPQIPRPKPEPKNPNVGMASAGDGESD